MSTHPRSSGPRLALLAAVLAGAACVPFALDREVKVTPERGAALELHAGQPLRIVRLLPARFEPRVRDPNDWTYAFLAAPQMLAVLAADAAVRQGAPDKLTAKYGLQDPAVPMAAALAQSLARPGRSPDLRTDPVPADAARGLTREGPVVVVRTAAWGLSDYPKSRAHPYTRDQEDHVRTGCRIEVAVLAPPDGRLVAHAECANHASLDAPRPTLEELQANGGLLLRESLARLGAECAADLAPRIAALLGPRGQAATAAPQ